LSSTNAYTLAQGTGGTLTLTNSGSAATIAVDCGMHSILAPINLLGGDMTISVFNSGELTIGGGISQDAARNLTLGGDGSGQLILSGTNDLGGVGAAVAVSSGTLVLASDNAIADGSNLTVGDASSFDGIPPAGEAVAAAGASAPFGNGLATVPEPSTLVLLASGTILFTLRRNRHKGNQMKRS
jgi:hypothetical protein